MRRVVLPLLLVAAVASLATTEASAGKVIIKMATLAPDGSAWDKQLKLMADEWQKETEGRVRLRVYPGGVTGDDPDVVRKMRIGQLQGAALTVAGLTQIDDSFNVFSIPLFFASYDEFLYVRSKLTPMLEKKLEENGFKFLHWGYGGWVHVFLTKPVESVDDLKKVKMFTWAGNDRVTEVYKSVGFSPVPLAATDIMTGLQTGLIDAMPTTPYACLAMQFFRQTPYMLGQGLAPLVGATLVTMKTWDKISPEDQAALLAAGRRADAELAPTIQEGDREAIAEMEKRGLSVIGVDMKEGRWGETARAFADQMRKEVVPDDVYRAALQYRDDYRRQNPGDASSGDPR